MKRYLVKLNYTVQAQAHFVIDENQLKEALDEERYGELEGEDWQKAEKLFEETGEDIANEISQSTWDNYPLELGGMSFTLRQRFRTDEAAEADLNTIDYNMCTEVEPDEVFLRLSRVAWINDIEVEENDSTH